MFIWGRCLGGRLGFPAQATVEFPHEVVLPGGAERWHPICIAAGGRHSMCMALPRHTVTDHERRQSALSGVFSVPHQPIGARANWTGALARMPPMISGERRINHTLCSHAQLFLPLPSNGHKGRAELRHHPMNAAVKPRPQSSPHARSAPLSRSVGDVPGVSMSVREATYRVPPAQPPFMRRTDSSDGGTSGAPRLTATTASTSSGHGGAPAPQPPTVTLRGWSAQPDDLSDVDGGHGHEQAAWPPARCARCALASRLPVPCVWHVPALWRRLVVLEMTLAKQATHGREAFT